MELVEYFPEKLRQAVGCMKIEVSDFTEIRIRMGQTVIFKKRNEEKFIVKKDGKPLIADRKMIDDLFGAIMEHSVYAYAKDIKQCFITLCGGHRVGFVGQAVMEDEKIKTIRNISSLNIRISHEIKGIGDELADKITGKSGVENTIIISPPGYGKTTLLRDVVRSISDGKRQRQGIDVSLIDERSEIAASYMGISQNNVGKRTDIFDSVPKDLGMMLATRCMSPKVIAVDEIGSEKDVEAIRYACKSGCSIIATAHGLNKESLKKNPILNKLLEEEYFQKFIVIKKDGDYYVDS